MMRIGRVQVARPLTLAPMEEHTSSCFRLLAKQFGAALVTSERVDAADAARRDRRALRLLHTSPAEAPRAGQTSGADPATLAEAARVVEELGFDLVDLNFECPIRRLLARGEGGALLSDPEAVDRIVAAVVRAVSIPVTLKIRSGPDDSTPNAPEIACRAAAAGAAAVCVHARSVARAYAGPAEWSIIAATKQAVSIPVIGSGGIREPADAVRMLRESGCDAVAIGRGALGNPWIFRQAWSLISGGATIRPPTPAERARVLLQLIEGEFHLYGATVALRRMPRTSCYFAHPLPNFPAFRSAVREIRTLAQFRALVKEHFR
jgi:tRNA-dihydrouridine synthase B